MLRYIYLLCFLYFELVFCYNYVHGKEHRRLRRRQEYFGHKNHRTTTTSAFENLDLVNFIIPEAEALDPYSYEKRERSSIDNLPLEVPTLRQRRSRQDPPVDDLNNARAHRRLHGRHLAHQPKKKCAFVMFPFFSHKNKTKTKPPAVKQDKRKSKSHPFRFSKLKELAYNPPMSPEREQILNQDTTDKMEVTTMKNINVNSKMKHSPKIIHNSRLYFANPYRITNEEGSYGN